MRRMISLSILMGLGACAARGAPPRAALSPEMRQALADSDRARQAPASGKNGDRSKMRPPHPYIQGVARRWSQSWKVPAEIEPGVAKDLFAVIVVRIDKSGDLLEIRFVRSSGNSAFDNAIKSTWKAIGQLDPPPAEVLPQVFGNGMALRIQTPR